MKKKNIWLATTTLSLAAIIPVSMIPILQPAVIASNYALVDNRAQQEKALTVQPDTLEELEAANINDVTSLREYDSRKYKIITYPKDQGQEGLCWTYATAAASETALLKTGLENRNLNEYDQIDLDEHNIDFGTNLRYPEFDKLGLNPDDNIYHAQLGKGGNVRWALAALSMWNTPVNQYPNGQYRPAINGYEYHPAEYQLENADMLPNSKTLASKITWPATIKKIKEMIVKYGAVSCSYTAQGTFHYTNTNLKPANGGHAVTLVGWDDNISRTKYQGMASEFDGGWIVKNSWGRDHGPNKDGYFYISYDSEIFDITGYDYTKANTKYQNNYYYDARAAQDASGIDSEQSGKKENAAIFPVKKANFNRKELLKGINVGFQGENATVTAKVYENVDADFLNPLSLSNNPIKGEPVRTVTKQFEHGGYKTLELEQPLELEHGKNFSVVVKVENDANDAEILYSIEKANDNMTYYHNGSTWINPSLRESNLTARIKAFTSDEPIANAEVPNNLEYAEVKLSQNDWKYNDSNKPVPSEVRLGSTVLNLNQDYEVVDGPINLALPPNGVSRDDAIIGNASLIIKGKNQYANTSKTIHYKLRVGTAPDLQNLGEYWWGYDNSPTQWNINLKVKSSAKTYREIKIPDNWEWYAPNPGDLDQSVSDGPSKLDLVYRGSDADCYRKTWFGANRVTLKVVPDGDVVPSDPKPLPEVNNQNNGQITPPPIVPAPQPTQKLNDVRIDINKTNCNEGDLLTATAIVNPGSLANVGYRWYIGNQELRQFTNARTISFNALRQYHNQALRVEVTYNSQMVANQVVLSVQENNSVNPIVPDNNHDKPSENLPTPDKKPNGGKPTNNDGFGDVGLNNTSSGDSAWIAYTLVGTGAVSVISAGVVVYFYFMKRKNKARANKTNLYRNSQKSNMKSIPEKTSKPKY